MGTIQISRTEPLIELAVESNEIKEIQSADDEHEVIQVVASINQTLEPQIYELTAATCEARHPNELNITPTEIHMAAGSSTQFVTKLSNRNPVNNQSTTPNYQPEIQMGLFDHTYAMSAYNEKDSKMYRCDNSSIAKGDVQCPACSKKFTQRGLRIHELLQTKTKYIRRSDEIHDTQLRNSS